MQVILESNAECEEAQKLIRLIKSSYPEVLTSIKTKQLAQEILLHKASHIGDVAKTGEPSQPPILHLALIPSIHSAPIKAVCFLERKALLYLTDCTC